MVLCLVASHASAGKGIFGILKNAVHDEVMEEQEECVQRETPSIQMGRVQSK